MKGILDKLNPQKAVDCDSTPSGFYAYQLLPWHTADQTDQSFYHLQVMAYGMDK